MATVFMKWLETSPEQYDRGIQMLTLGRLKRVHEKIATEYVETGNRILEIGCGTGSLAITMAQNGARVTGIDSSKLMLAVAEEKVNSSELQDCISLETMDATTIGDHFSRGSFDLIVSTLVFSELPVHQQRFVLAACTDLLAPTGRLLIADEVMPKSAAGRWLYFLLRLPLALLTWFLTRATTQAVRGFEDLLREEGFVARPAYATLGGTLVLFEGQLVQAADKIPDSPPAQVARLRHRPTWHTRLVDLWLLLWRIAPPYPKFNPGLYAIGKPDATDPVLVTGNFDLTVRRVVKALDGHLDAWLLVADSAGINVWCASGGGYFTAERVIAAVNASRLNEVVKHRALILPQLCANGVDGWKVRMETGWGVHWGPVKAADIPAYVNSGRKKTDKMRWVDFPLRDRLEMVTVSLGFYALLVLGPLLVFWRQLFWPVTISLLGLSYFYAVVHPWLPGRDGLRKSVPLTLIALAGLLVYAGTWGSLPLPRLFNWAMGTTALSIFIAAELQGMSPHMRGEQANWSWEALIGAAIGLVSWLVPMALKWR